MTDRTDLADRLDAAIGSAPEPFPPARTTALLAAGRRARTRRRAVLGASALGVGVLVAAGVALGAAGDDRAGIEPSVATDPGDPSAGVPSPSASPSDLEPSPSPARDVLLPGERVALTLDGELVVRDGVEVLQRVADPLGSTPPAHSLGLAVRDGATTYWYLLDTDGRQGTGSSSDEARRAFPTLRAWLDDQVALQTGRPTLALVRFTADGRLAPLDGVTLVRQRTDVRLGNDFAGPGDRTAVAEVRWRGGTWFVAARRLPGSPTGVLPHRRVGVRPHPRRLPGVRQRRGTPSRARACDEGRGRRVVRRVRARPAGPPAPDRLRRLR